MAAAALLAMDPVCADGADVGVTVKSVDGAPLADIALVLEAVAPAPPAHHREKLTRPPMRLRFRVGASRRRAAPRALRIFSTLRRLPDS